MAVIALIPGASTFVGALIAWPAIQMILRHDTPALPGFLSRRMFSAEKFSRVSRAFVPRFRWIEKLIRPRWRVVFRMTRPCTGTLMLLLGLSMISPFPFSHVIPALIHRFVEARDSGLAAVTLWGCGSATREFMHVDDAARGLLAALQHDTGDGPLNLGSGEEISIRDLAHLLQALTGYRGEIAWDPARPEGQRRRRLDVSRAWERLGFRPEIPLREGLAETVRWYEARRSRRAPA